LGEEWYLLQKKVKGGSIIVGESSIVSPPNIDDRLENSVRRFGDSIESATDPGSRDPNEPVDFAVLDDHGTILDAYGGIPLKATKTGLLFTEDGSVIYMSSTVFLVHKVAIIDQAKRQRGTIVVIKNIELEMNMLHQTLVFNAVVAVISLLLCGFVLVLEFREVN